MKRSSINVVSSPISSGNDVGVLYCVCFGVIGYRVKPTKLSRPCRFALVTFGILRGTVTQELQLTVKGSTKNGQGK